MEGKYYAIKYKNGYNRIIFGLWEDIKHKIKGRKGITYKSFPHRAFAEQWLKKEDIKFRHKNTEFEKDVIYIFVDGAYSSIDKCAGWGWVAVKNDEKLDEGWGFVDNVTVSLNVVGELKGATEGIKWAIKEGHRDVVIVHDYSGIGNWALGYWEARSDVAVSYSNFIRYIEGLIKLKFEKVDGHSDIEWNDYADALTRKYQFYGKEDLPN